MVYRKPIRCRFAGALVLAVWTAAIHCLLTGVGRADFRVLNDSSVPELFISGTITERDAKAIERLSPWLDRIGFTVRLDSTGGDVGAAMRIGRTIRKYEGMTSIDKEPSGFNANCYSSCALIFISGVHRFIVSDGGQLGLHRPYFSSMPQSRQTIEKQIPLMLSQVKEYIAEMGVTDDFYQQMVNTEPSKMAVYGNTNTESLTPMLRQGMYFRSMSDNVAHHNQHELTV